MKDLIVRLGFERLFLLVPVRNPGLVKMITARFPRYPQPLQVSRISVHDLGARLDAVRIAVQPPVECAGDTGACTRRKHDSRNIALNRRSLVLSSAIVAVPLMGNVYMLPHTTKSLPKPRLCKTFRKDRLCSAHARSGRSLNFSAEQSRCT